MQTTNSALALFCAINRRRLPLLTTRSSSKLIALQSFNFLNHSDASENDWFKDGREAARQLKRELEIVNSDDDTFDSDIKREELDENVARNNAAMESGRAAARELLKEIIMNHAIDGNGMVDESSPRPKLISEKSVIQQEKLAESSSFFGLPVRKSHCMTICLVPPPNALTAWEQFTTVRRECKDPGFFRWPPHANILYPFIEPVFFRSKDGMESSIKDQSITTFRNELISHLSRAAENVEPFDVTIDSFGTFGNSQRGVLWAYPKSHCKQKSHDKLIDEEPLIRLHRLLEQQFPMCNDTRKTGAFHPHMTISHYADNYDAETAKVRVASGWKSVSFHVPEIYLLERRGDDGQFKSLATIPLGTADSKKEVQFYDSPVSFPGMPRVEEKWVYDERMDMKTRRKNNMRRGRKGGRGSNERDRPQELHQEANG